jgi:CRP/FNR family cyclic AMP-dependent transcriptional regulator
MYLPRKPIKEIGKGRVIYSPQNSSDHLYMVIRGRVTVTTTARECETISRILCTEDLCGEAVLVGGHSSETAVVLDAALLMSWTRDEIEAQIEREPRLGVGLARYFVRQCLALQDRIEAAALYKTPERVLLAFAQLADLLGTPQPDGAMRIASLPHHTIADYVGTSREIVTCQMNRIRKLGLIRYNRRYIDVYSCAVAEALSQYAASAKSNSDRLRRSTLYMATQSMCPTSISASRRCSAGRSRWAPLKPLDVGLGAFPLRIGGVELTPAGQ